MSEKQTEALADCEKAKSEWRKLALAFDNHRMQAIWHLRAMLDNPSLARPTALKFLETAPKRSVSPAVEALAEEHLQSIMKLVKAYGEMVLMKGHSSFECEKKAYEAIEEALRASYTEE